MRLSGRTIMVTGAAGGIGRAICRTLAANGARLVVADMPGAGAEDFAAQLPDAVAVELDVTDEAQWIAALDRAEDASGALYGLVNNAGFFQPNIALEDMPLDLWRRHFAVNADGTFLGCKHAIRRLKSRRDGAVVNIGSGMSIKAQADAAAYCASKAAVLMTTRTAAASAGAYNIRVNAVLPGAVDTPMLMGNLVGEQTREDLLARLTSYSPMGRLATAEDIAHAVAMLMDPASRAISGVYLPVDCGNMPGA